VNIIFLTDSGSLKYTVRHRLQNSGISKEENMTAALLLLWALTGGALSTWLMMHIWLPDPPPNIVVRFFGVLIAGIVGGVVAGYLVSGAEASSNHIPGIVAAAAGGLILSGVVAVLGGGRGGAAR
jgi:hypothetical protein